MYVSMRQYNGRNVAEFTRRVQEGFVPIVRQVVDGVQTLARERDVDIKMTIPADPLLVLGDRDELERAWPEEGHSWPDRRRLAGSSDHHSAKWHSLHGCEWS